jgi:hypothetical protein
LTLVSGDSLSGLDFGTWSPASVSGTVFEDSDADGAQDAGEPGFSARTVYSDSDGNSTLDAGEPSTTTAGDGSYTLSDLTPGDHTIRTVVPAGSTCSAPSPCEHAVTLDSGDTPSSKDFGTWSTASVSGTVFEDADADGSQDAGEPGIPGRTVYSDIDGDSTFDAGEPSATTAGDGSYTLSGLVPGELTIRTVVPGGQICSAPSPCRHSLTLGSGDALTKKDFGTFEPASTGNAAGAFFHDLDGDGGQDAGEPGLPGVTVYIDLDDDSTLDPGEPNADSGGSGEYAIPGVPAGDYSIRAVIPAGWTCSAPVACSYPLTFTGSGTAAGNDFGAFTTATVSGTVFDDSDADGAQDAGEPGIAGRTVYSDTDGDSTFDAGEPSTTTAGDGTYTLSDLTPGDHTIRTVVPAGSTCSAPSPCEHAVALASTDTAVSKDFGTWSPASVSGTVFDDSDTDGAQDAGEPGIAGRTVYSDTDGDSTFDAGEPSTTTAADGTYTLAGLTLGDHTIRTVVLAGWTCSAPSPCEHTLTLDSGDAEGSNDFGTWTAAPTGSASGTLFHDLDGDGQQDAGEGPLAGRAIYADLDGDGTKDPGEPETTTDADGDWSLTGLPVGTYPIREETPSGWSCSEPEDCDNGVTITAGSNTTQNFANYMPVTINGRWFLDSDSDGTQDAGEPGLGGWTVYVDLNGNSSHDPGEPADTTDGNGDYSIPGVRPGSYNLRVVSGDGSPCPAVNGCSHPVVLVSSPDPVRQDLASQPPAAGAPVAQPPAAQPPTAQPPAAGPPRQCVSRRTVKLRVRETKRFKPVAAKIWFRGKRVKVRRQGGRLSAVLNMKGLTAGRYPVKFAVRTRSGRTIKGFRYYYTCTKSRGGKRLAIP